MDALDVTGFFEYEYEYHFAEYEYEKSPPSPFYYREGVRRHAMRTSTMTACLLPYHVQAAE